MEIVSEPDIRSADEAAAYVRYLRTMMQYLETCDGNMEQGSLRCDINLSVRKPGEDFGTRCEIKNVNSIRHVVDAIHYESRRQVDLIEEGGVVVQETRLWDTGAGVTRSMRSKEEAHDYRYFPDPDLLPLIVDDEWVDRVQNNMPELPVEKKTRFIDEYGLSDYDADVLVTQKPRADYFEQVVGGDDDKDGRNPKTVANWVINELLGQLNKQEQDIDDSPVSANQLGQLIDLIEDNTISGRIAKDVFEDMFATGKDPEKIVEDKGLKQITDTDALGQVVAQVLAENPVQVENYKGGKKKLLGYFVGQCMQKTKGKANPQQVNQLLREKLD
jgi:aspartyl-tRNA(Asn)/glutamyl-tRNA(Gln) amidotransferase subunit B